MDPPPSPTTWARAEATTRAELENTAQKVPADLQFISQLLFDSNNLTIVLISPTSLDPKKENAKLNVENSFYINELFMMRSMLQDMIIGPLPTPNHLLSALQDEKTQLLDTVATLQSCVADIQNKNRTLEDDNQELATERDYFKNEAMEVARKSVYQTVQLELEKQKSSERLESVARHAQQQLLHFHNTIANAQAHINQAFIDIQRWAYHSSVQDRRIRDLEATIGGMRAGRPDDRILIPGELGFDAMVPVVVPDGFVAPPAPRVALSPLNLQEWRERVATEGAEGAEQVEDREEEVDMNDCERWENVGAAGESGFPPHGRGSY